MELMYKDSSHVFFFNIHFFVEFHQRKRVAKFYFNDLDLFLSTFIFLDD